MSTVVDLLCQVVDLTDPIDQGEFGLDPLDVLFPRLFSR
jgi:hypothetical protein